MIFHFQALDKMILYLRIVHSLDYYVAADYQDEDDMPHKCGIIHVRAGKPTHKVTQSDGGTWFSDLWQKKLMAMNCMEFIIIGHLHLSVDLSIWFCLLPIVNMSLGFAFNNLLVHSLLSLLLLLMFLLLLLHWHFWCCFFSEWMDDLVRD